MKRNNPFDCNDPRFLKRNNLEPRSDVTSSIGNLSQATNSGVSERQNQSNANLPNTDARIIPPTTTHNFQYGPFGNSDSNQNQGPMPFPRMWPNNMLNYPISNNLPGGTNINPFQRNADIAAINGNDGHNDNTARPLSPVVEFSKDELESVIQKLEDSSNLRSALQTIINWLNKEECTKETVHDFFRLLNAVHKQVWRIMMEKASLKDSMNVKKKEVSQEMQEISTQYNEILKVTDYAIKQKVWDQFTKSQRKQLSHCFEDIRSLAKELTNFVEDTEDEDINKSPDSTTDCDRAEREEFERLQENTDLYNHRIETCCEETTSINIEEEESVPKHKSSIGELIKESNVNDKNLKDLKNFKEEAIKKPKPSKKVSTIRQQTTCAGSSNLQGNMRLVALIGVFLSVHPEGATVDYIHSYIINLDKNVVDIHQIESLLQKHPGVFKEQFTGTGYNMRKSWVFGAGALTLN